MHPERKIWPVAALLLVFCGLTLYFARRIEVGSVVAYLTLICGVAAVVALAAALVMLWLKRRG